MHRFQGLRMLGKLLPINDHGRFGPGEIHLIGREVQLLGHKTTYKILLARAGP